MDKPAFYSTIRQLREANHFAIQKELRDVSQTQLSNAKVSSLFNAWDFKSNYIYNTQAVQKVNVGTSHPIYTNLMQLNVNDATFTSNSFSSTTTKQKFADTIPQPHLHEFVNQMCPLNHFEPEPVLRLQTNRREYCVHAAISYL